MSTDNDLVSEDECSIVQDKDQEKDATAGNSDSIAARPLDPSKGREEDLERASASDGTLHDSKENRVIIDLEDPKGGHEGEEEPPDEEPGPHPTSRMTASHHYHLRERENNRLTTKT